MTDFDEKIKKSIKNLKVPEEYDRRVEETLQSIRDDDTSIHPNRWKGVVTLVCLCIAAYLLFSNSEIVQANFLETFKGTILDFFGMGKEEAQTVGVKSEKEESVSKPDLIIELQEKVIDDQNIYLVVKITAPSDVEFNEDISFDYFAFYRGANYNTEDLLPGARDCRLLEVLEGKSNVATYIVSLSSDEELTEDSELTAFFKDLMVSPNGDHPEMLVEGIWSVNFTVEKTVSEEVQIKGTPDMTYPFINTTATLSKLKLSPLGLTLVSDVSNVPDDELGISDTTIALRLKMIDGSEKVVMSHNAEERTIISSGSDSFSQKKGKTYMKGVYQFEKTINISQVIGVYIEDYYVPLIEY